MDLLAPEPDMEIVGFAEEEADALSAARQEGANLVITQESGTSTSGPLGAILTDLPLTILSIDAGGDAGTSVAFLRRRHSLQLGSGNGLAQVVRNALESPLGTP